MEKLIQIPAGRVVLEGDLQVPPDPKGIILFAHGSGSSRHSPRNQYVARVLYEGGLVTLLIDLLTLEEERIDERTRRLRFDIALLADRLVAVTDWMAQEEEVKRLQVGYFGASTGAAAALVAASKRPNGVRAVVSRGGRPDLAESALPRVLAPTLLLVGGEDGVVIELNEQAMQQLVCEKKLSIIPRATHLFEEPGTLEEVARLALAWFQEHFNTPSSALEAP